jgi:hypothetical protein
VKEASVEKNRQRYSSPTRALVVLAAAGAILALAAPVRAQLSDRIRINGYSSFEWEYQVSNHDEGKGDKNGSFDADLFDIVLNVQATDRLRVAADLTWEHGPATEDGRGNVAAEYAFAEYTVSDALKLRAGKMFVPFGIYNEIHTAKPAFIPVDEPYATNKPDKLGAPGRSFARWGAGLEAVGSFGSKGLRGDYSLLVFNGESDAVNPFEEDDNGSKALAARLRLEPHSSLKLGVSGYRDVHTVYDDEGEDTGETVAQTAVGASLEWSPREFEVELEWVRAEIPAGGTARVTSNAFAAVLSRRIGTHFTPYIEGQYLDPDDNTSNDAAGILIAGVNIRVDTGLFVKLEVDRYISQDANSRFEGVGFTQLAGAVAVGF